MPRTVPKSTRERSLTGSPSKNSMLRRAGSTRGSRGARLMARLPGSPGACTGQASTHNEHPVQSSTYTWREYRVSGRPRASSGMDGNESGAPASSDWS